MAGLDFWAVDRITEDAWKRHQLFDEWRRKIVRDEILAMLLGKYGE